MYFDFNIPYNERTQVENILARIQSSQNATIALSITSNEPLTTNSAQPIEPIATDRFPNIKQLKRVTIQVTDPKQNYQLVSSNIANKNVDILAVRPMTLDATKHACQTYDADIISLDFHAKHVVPNHATAQLAIQRGMFFEVCYAPAFRSAHHRNTFFSNVKRLIEVTRGDNIIFSSDALQALELRSANDMKMFGQLLGMSHTQVEAAVSQNCQRLLLKAETRQSTLNAVIRMDFIVPEPENQSSKRKADQNESEPNQKKKKKNKAKNNKNV
ncbi:ribonuclease p subunit rpp30 [Lichtheimia corymbifera JMRC:FSU:9682]|uniref:Ribonuclease p subunit rpp30 n=1 Tax=Lichtheimia corymbifera JMRC:FSU:9682 TaxID=1263082 RepID=A0A068RN10_9FUNG|nr:ribonuclease p subunit rpp30 [Lichtheimia corymbifera JMRC:FSU:9682]